MKDLKGNVIEQRPKDGHSVEIDGTSRFSGHRFLLKTKLYGDKRCIYCGRWFHWTPNTIRFIGNNIDKLNKDGELEPLHCGSNHCKDFHEECLRWDKIHKEIEAHRRATLFLDMFKRLKKQGVIG